MTSAYRRDGQRFFPYDSSCSVRSTSSSRLASGCGRSGPNLAQRRDVRQATLSTEDGLRGGSGIDVPRSRGRALVDHIRLRRHAQPLRPRPRRQGLQPVRAGDQAARDGDRGRPPRPARRAEQLDGVLLAEAGQPQQGERSTRRGHRQTQAPGSDFYEFTGTKLEQFPLPAALPLERGRRARRSGAGISTSRTPASVVDAWLRARRRDGSRDCVWSDAAESTGHGIRAQMIFEQEELDWEIYRLYGLLDERPHVRGG